MSDIEKENIRCMNPFSLPMRLKGRQPKQERPNTDKIYKLSKVKNAGKPELITEGKVFDFGKEVKKPKKNIKKTTKTKMDNVLEVEDMIGNKKKPKLNKNY